MVSTASRVKLSVWPEEILNLPKVEIPISGVTGHILKNSEKQVVFFHFPEGTTVPDHNHSAQYGYLVTGEMTLEIEGRTELHSAGDKYYIPAGVKHRTSFSRDSFVIDMSSNLDRY